MAQKDLYSILGVKDTASDDEIKKAYREAAKKNHPDKTGGDKGKESKFKDISSAYEVLSDPKRRAEYDQLRRGGFPMDGSAFRGGAGGPGGFAGGSGLEDILSQMFGGNFGAGTAAGPGATRRVIFEQDLPRGGRRRPPPAPEPEPEIEQILRTKEGHEFTRRGDDLFIDLPLSIEEAVLGAKVDVPTLTGKVTMTIPPGTSSGKKMRLRGKGWQGAGDQYVTTQIIVPTEVDEKAANALRDFAKRAPVKPRR